LQRQAIIDAHAELRERELLKRTAMAGALAAALGRRGVGDPSASLAAEIGDLALATAYTAWLAPGADAEFGEVVQRALGELRSAATTLG
jgi:hypothetical protein